METRLGTLETIVDVTLAEGTVEFCTECLNVAHRLLMLGQAPVALYYCLTCWGRLCDHTKHLLTVMTEDW